ncbi:hypothetical protein SAY86_011385 [Trapa natans]|uniref:Uncharacterized protein n=1 Tax=Trapa natans TaxID=22666 RepID=A0AAN7LWY6_TRANT|nr:hypothetical protein SAY86_011385 [Trapa natans]
MDCCRQTILRGDEIGKKARRFVLREEKFYGCKGRADEAISRFSEIALFFVTTIAFEDTLCTAALIYCHFEYQEKFNPIDVYSLEVADPSLDDDGRPKRTGHKRMVLCGLLQYLSLYVTAVAYVITVSTSMRAVHRANCYHKEGHNATCNTMQAFSDICRDMMTYSFLLDRSSSDVLSQQWFYRSS